MPVPYSELMNKLGKICDVYAIRKVFGEKFLLVYLPIEGCCMQVFTLREDELSIREIRICGILNIGQSERNIAEVVRPLSEGSVLYWESARPDAEIPELRRAIGRIGRIQAQRNRRFSRKILAYLSVRSRQCVSER